MTPQEVLKAWADGKKVRHKDSEDYTCLFDKRKVVFNCNFHDSVDITSYLRSSEDCVIVEEPEYYYQWVGRVRDGEIILSNYVTDEEAEQTYLYDKNIEWIRKESSKTTLEELMR